MRALGHAKVVDASDIWKTVLPPIQLNANGDSQCSVGDAKVTMSPKMLFSQKQ